MGLNTYRRSLVGRSCWLLTGTRSVLEGVCHSDKQLHIVFIHLLRHEQVVIDGTQEVELKVVEGLGGDAHSPRKFIIVKESLVFLIKMASLFIVFDSKYYTCAK